MRNQEAYKILKNVRGSPSYWQSELYDVLAMLHIIGIPTFFLTLLAADLHWPEMIQVVASQHGRKMSCEDVLQMSLCERSDYLWNKPMTGVCLFEHRVENFFPQYLLSSSMPLGKISDHVIKIEFQMRGTPHAHFLLWIEGAPKIDNSSDNAVCEFIDKYITAVTPQATWEGSHINALVTHLQKHVSHIQISNTLVVIVGVW